MKRQLDEAKEDLTGKKQILDEINDQLDQEQKSRDAIVKRLTPKPSVKPADPEAEENNNSTPASPAVVRTVTTTTANTANADAAVLGAKRSVKASSSKKDVAVTESDAADTQEAKDITAPVAGDQNKETAAVESKTNASPATKDIADEETPLASRVPDGRKGLVGWLIALLAVLGISTEEVIRRSNNNNKAQ